jgi:hypothetical protein
MICHIIYILAVSLDEMALEREREREIYIVLNMNLTNRINLSIYIYIYFIVTYMSVRPDVHTRIVSSLVMVRSPIKMEVYRWENHLCQ